MNKCNKGGKANSISTFDFSTLHAKLYHNKLLIALNNLIHFCFDGGENKYVLVTSYGSRWVKDIKYNQIYFTKLQKNDVVVYLSFSCFFNVGPVVFCQIFDIPMQSDQDAFFTNFFLLIKIKGCQIATFLTFLT